VSRHQDSQTDRKREETQFTPYSAEAIAQQYRYKPWQLFGRAFVIIWSLGLFLLSLLWDKWTKQEEANKYRRASELRQILTRLGPTFIKVGQALSTRPDLVRKDFLDELVKLQDQLPPFDTKLFEEIDYQNEGRNAEKFATNFQNNPEVKVPSIYWRYSGRRVLTLEWIDGYKLTDTEKIKALGLDPNNIVKIGVTSGLQQLLEHGFFHADPHPGNLFATFDGRMAYIDFGMMDQLEEETKETLASCVVDLINKDYENLASNFVKLGFLTPETDIKPIIPALERVLGNAIGQRVGDFNFRTITDDFSELMYEYPFRIPAKFALIIRSLVTQEGAALTLDPNFKIVQVAYPYVAKRLLTGESPQLRRRLLDVLFKDGKFQWQRLENMITMARSESNFDLLPTAQLGITFLLSEEGRYLRRQLLLALTEDDRLHTAEVQRLWGLIQGELQPRRLLDVAMSAFRELSSQGVAAVLPRETSSR